MDEEALSVTLALAEAAHDLRNHLETKQQLLVSERVVELAALLGNETRIVRRLGRLQQELSAQLRRLHKLSPEGGFALWLDEIYLLVAPEVQAILARLSEDTIACQELQLQQQELMQRSLIYYQSLTRFYSGVQQWTYDKPE